MFISETHQDVQELVFWGKLEVVQICHSKFSKSFTLAGALEWKLVRSVPQGTTWHPATDGLSGTDVYGVETDLSQPFSKQFDNVEFNQVF